uniref:Uncharacterized protein n=1 Tax=Eutreptiella gymnastica TaxID=73025 RepID=A0A7S4G600_9EUGL
MVGSTPFFWGPDQKKQREKWSNPFTPVQRWDLCFGVAALRKKSLFVIRSSSCPERIGAPGSGSARLCASTAPATPRYRHFLSFLCLWVFVVRNVKAQECGPIVCGGRLVSAEVRGGHAQCRHAPNKRPLHVHWSTCGGP